MLKSKQQLQPTAANKKLLFRQFWRGQLIEVIREGPYRSLRFDSHLVQSRMLEDDPDRLVLNYSRHIIASLLFLPQPPQNILMIGLGAGSLVRFFLKHCPAARITVVEYNECIPPLAHKFFAMPKDPRVTIVIDDGARYIVNAKPDQESYDLIIVDAFDQSGMAQSVYSDIFFSAAKQLLSHNGVMTVNMTKGNHQFFDYALEMLSNCFAEGLLRLNVDQTNNEIVFACQQQQAWGDWSQPKQRAKELSKRFDINLLAFLEQIIPTGKTFWNRWSSRGKQV